MRRLIRLAHVYTGLVLSLLLLVLALTGSALVYKEAYWKLVYPELRGPDIQPGAAADASAIAAAMAAFGDRLRSVKMPEPGVPAYHLYLDGGEAFLSAHDHRVIDSWTPRERLMPLLFDVHAHLMAGERGERVGGIVGLLGVVLAATGLVLWWPARRRLRPRTLLPRDLARRTLLVWHRDLGAVAAPLLLLLLLTGSGLVFYETARTILNGAFGAAAAASVAPQGRGDIAPTALDARRMARVEAAFPDARVVFYYPPRAGATVHGFRLKRPCELHPNGRSYVYLDLAGDPVQTIDACALAPGDRAANAIYPLHAGKTESGAYRLIVFLGGIVLALLSFTGVVTYLQQLTSGGRSRARRRPGASDPAPATVEQARALTGPVP